MALRPRPPAAAVPGRHRPAQHGVPDGCRDLVGKALGAQREPRSWYGDRPASERGTPRVHSPKCSLRGATTRPIMGAREELTATVSRMIANWEGTNEFARECAERIVDTILRHKHLCEAAEEIHRIDAQRPCL